MVKIIALTLLLVCVLAAIGFWLMTSMPESPIARSNNQTQVSPEAKCGNGLCDDNENCENCLRDCTCPNTTICNLSDPRADNLGCHFFCGNGVCDRGETQCNCQQDCNSCPGSVETCEEFYCNGSACEIRTMPNCCGNGICNSNETKCSCPEDCGECSGFADHCKEYYCDGSNCSIRFNEICPALMSFEGDVVVMYTECKSESDCIAPGEAYCNKSLVKWSRCMLTSCSVKCDEPSPANIAPVLSKGTATAKGGQGSGGNYRFEVTYSDGNSDSPARVSLYLNGEAHPMVKDELYCSFMTGGCRYAYTKNLPAGDYEFFFSASDGKETVVLPANTSWTVNVTG